jgi:eukaryotic-like serine/threonine-protein kinase
MIYNALSFSIERMCRVIGTTISHYKILEKLGGGGMGVVYKAQDVQLGRFVAIKCLPERLAKDPQALERFHREARAIAALDHPNICAIYDFGEHEGQPFIAMQLLEGTNLKERIQKKSLTIEEVVDLGIQITDGLDKAHSRGIIHRDIKPANIFITTDGHAKLLDFGLAKAMSDDDTDLSALPTAAENLTNPGVIVGTIAYMSPEQAHGLELDARADVFSVGTVLYEMATGQPAFSGKTNATIFDRILNRAPVAPLALNSQIPARLEEIILKALEKDREIRFQSAADIRADLKRLRRDTESALSVAVPVEEKRPATKRNWVALGAIAISCAVGVLTLLLVVGRRLPTRVPEPAAPAAALPLDRRLTQLFSSSQDISNPSISADGKTVVYAEYDQGQWDLFVSRIAGGARVRITNDAAAESLPKFSPDGEKILFTRLLPGAESPEISMTSALGGDITPLMSNASSAVWSPDGSQFAYISFEPDKSRAVAIAGTNGQVLRKILRTDTTYTGISGLAWSPDGAQLAAIRSIGGVTGEIWIVPAGGGQARRLSKDPPEVFSHNPVFTPDSRAIVHTSNRGGATNVWSAALDGSQPVRITTGSGPDTDPSVARDGTITFLNSRDRQGLFVHDLSSGKSRVLITHSSFLWAPAFSADGKDIAFSRFEADGSWHIWTVPQTGETARRLTPGPLPEIYPRFTPDGKWITYFTWGSQQPNRIWKIPRTGGVPQPITPARTEDDAYPDVSPDGKSIAFARTEGKMTRVYIMPFDGGEARLLTKSQSTIPRWSPDGRQIAFSPVRSYDGGVFVISAEGFGERRLTDIGGWPVWWPDGKQIAYLIVGPDGNQQVRVVPVAGGPSKALEGLHFLGTNYPIDLFRNNLLTTSNSVHLSSEIWLLH